MAIVARAILASITAGSVGVIALYSAVAASPTDWCDFYRDKFPTTFEICVAAAPEDDAECRSTGLEGKQYSTCRWQLLMMRDTTGTPPGNVAIVGCRLPSGSLISMNIKTCKAQGGIVEN